ncbi:M16 family metallopeptidase [Nonomuraea ferruginea]
MSRPVHVAERGAAPAWLAHRPGAAVTTVSVWLRAGSRHERPGVEGGTHLLEHILMQVPSAGGERVIDLLEDLGGEANAITSREHLVLYARVPSEEAAAALDILARALAEPELSAPVLEAERKVVQEELRLAAADPLDVVHDIFFGLAYPGHPLGRPVGGTIEEVGRLELDALRDHHRRFLGSAGVVVCGGADPDDLLRVLDKGPLAALPPWQESDPGEPPAWGGGREALRLNADTTGVVLGGPAAAYRDPLRHRWPVLMELLAGASSALLTEELRNRRGLCYELWPMVAPLPRRGDLAGLPRHRARTSGRGRRPRDGTARRAALDGGGGDAGRQARCRAAAAGSGAVAGRGPAVRQARPGGGHPHWTLADELAAIEAVRGPGLAEIPGPLAVATAGGA